MSTSTIVPALGIDNETRLDIAEGLSHLLADSYALYVLSHNFHWNVTGPMFQSLHVLFEEQYTELAVAIDEIAERIRALGAPAPGTFAAFQSLSTVAHPEGQPTATEMTRLLMEAQETVVRTARKVLPTAAEADDEPTVDLLTQRMQVHEKNAWMLRSLLAD